MTQRMFVCHAKSDIEATSEIVDALEGALELKSGTLIASSLPGYAEDVRGEGDLHATLTGAALMLAMFTERSTYDPEFVFELGAAWALGIDVLPVLLGATNEADIPWPLRDRPTLRAKDPSAWNDLVHQLSSRLQVSIRDHEAPEPSEVPQPGAASFFEPGSEIADGSPLSAAERELPVPEMPPALATPFQAQLEAVEALQAAYERTKAQAAAELAIGSVEDGNYAAAVAMLDADDAAAAAAEAAADAEDAAATAAEAAAEAEAVAEAAELAAEEAAAEQEAAEDEAAALAETISGGRRANPVSIVAPVKVAGGSVNSAQSFNLAADAFEPRSDIRPHLPSYCMSLEAGRALSDCVFNRDEGLDFKRELEVPLGRFVDAMGGSWAALSNIEDIDVWLGAVENLLQNLPDDDRRISAWYELGYELAILHNLAGQGLFDTEEQRQDAERLWRKSLERLLIRAENAMIPYEELARVLALLENLAGPRDERDLSNIGRSLEELRRQAAGADRQHTAA